MTVTTRPTKTLTIRKPTMKAPWPMILVRGTEKTGKTWSAAAASASPLIGRTLWIGIGEDQPDEYGLIPGARFEIVEHDGTFRDILATVDAVVEELKNDEMPGMIVLDSMTRLWNLLSDEAQMVVNERAARKAARMNRPPSADDVQITMDLWNSAAQKWARIMDCLRRHQGPVVMTARCELVTGMEDGQPAAEKIWKTQTHKSLPYEVTAVIDIPAAGKAALTGVKSALITGATTGLKALGPTFTIDQIWRDMGLADGAGVRHHQQIIATGPTDAHSPSPTQVLLNEIGPLADRAGVTRQQIADDWAQTHDGEMIAATTDVGGLELLRDDLKLMLEQADAAAVADMVDAYQSGYQAGHSGQGRAAAGDTVVSTVVTNPTAGHNPDAPAVDQAPAEDEGHDPAPAGDNAGDGDGVAADAGEPAATPPPVAPPAELNERFNAVGIHTATARLQFASRICNKRFASVKDMTDQDRELVLAALAPVNDQVAS